MKDETTARVMANPKDLLVQKSTGIKTTTTEKTKEIERINKLQ